MLSKPNHCLSGGRLRHRCRLGLSSLAASSAAILGRQSHCFSVGCADRPPATRAVYKKLRVALEEIRGFEDSSFDRVLWPHVLAKFLRIGITRVLWSVILPKLLQQDNRLSLVWPNVSKSTSRVLILAATRRHRGPPLCLLLRRISCKYYCVNLCENVTAALPRSINIQCGYS